MIIIVICPLDIEYILVFIVDTVWKFKDTPSDNQHLGKFKWGQINIFIYKMQSVHHSCCLQELSKNCPKIIGDVFSASRILFYRTKLDYPYRILLIHDGYGGENGKNVILRIINVFRELQASQLDIARSIFLWHVSQYVVYIIWFQ